MSSPIKTQLRLKMENWKYVLKSTHLKKVKLRKALKYLANVYSGSRQKLSKNAQNSVLDAITWHHYYMNGHTAQLEDFLDEKNLNGLPKLINTGSFHLEFVSISQVIWPAINSLLSLVEITAFRLERKSCKEFFFINKFSNNESTQIYIMSCYL